MTESLDEESNREGGIVMESPAEGVQGELPPGDKLPLSYKIGKAVSYAVMSVLIALPFVAYKMRKKK